MKCFLLGLSGSLLGIVLAIVFYPLYSDYRARAESSVWVVQVQPLKNEIEKHFADTGIRTLLTENVIVKNFTKDTFRPNNVSRLIVNLDGTIIIKGGVKGQVLVMIPSFKSDAVTWTCIGGNADSVVYQCN